MAKKSSSTIEVDIYGSTYRVRGSEDPKDLEELAGYVDRKMREVADHVRTVDSTKIAVLAALNIADELFRDRKGRDAERDVTEFVEKVATLTGELESALQ